MIKPILTLFIISNFCIAEGTPKKEDKRNAESTSQRNSGEDLVEQIKTTDVKGQNLFGNLEDNESVKSENSFDNENLQLYLEDGANLVNESSFSEEELLELCNKPMNFYFPSVKGKQLDDPLTFLNNKQLTKLPMTIYDKTNFDSSYTKEGIFNIQDNQSGVSFMLRIFPKESLLYFAKEYNNLKRFENANINSPIGVPMFQGCVVDDKRAYMILAPRKSYMPLSLPGLREKIADLTTYQRKDLYVRLAELLSFVHKKQIAHGSFSPDNIYVDEGLTEFRLDNFKMALNTVEFINFEEAESSFLRYIQPKNGEDLLYNDVINLLQVILYLEMDTRTSNANSSNRAKELFIRALYGFEKEEWKRILSDLLYSNCDIKEEKALIDSIEFEEQDFIPNEEVADNVVYDCNALISLLVRALNKRTSVDELLEGLNQLSPDGNSSWGELPKAGQISFVPEIILSKKQTVEDSNQFNNFL